MATLTYAYVPSAALPVWVIDKTSCVPVSSGNTCGPVRCSGGCNCYGSCSCSSNGVPASAPAIREGVVIRMRAEQLINASPTVKYDVRFGQNAGTKEFAEADIYPTLADAVAAYQALLA